MYKRSILRSVFIEGYYILILFITLKSKLCLAEIAKGILLIRLFDNSNATPQKNYL